MFHWAWPRAGAGPTPTRIAVETPVKKGDDEKCPLQFLEEIRLKKGDDECG